MCGGDFADRDGVLAGVQVTKSAKYGAEIFGGIGLILRDTPL